MTTLTRRALVGALAAGPLLTRPARAAEITLKLGNNMTMAHPMNASAAKAAERIAQASDGRIALQLFPSSQLGSDTDMLAQVRSGALEFFCCSGLILATLVPVASINGVGFAFKDYAQVWAAMDGKLGALVRAAVAKKSLVAMEHIFDNGFRSITSSVKPIVAPKDLAGMKIRVPVSPMWTSLFTALGASPVSINFNEVYSALQTHVVDGQENPMVAIHAGKLYEVQKYLSLTRHMWDGYWPLANARALDRLKPEDREIVTREINRAVIEQRVDAEKLNAELGKTLQGLGMQVNEVDPAPFRDRLIAAGFYKTWREKYGDEAWGVLSEASGGGLP